MIVTSPGGDMNAIHVSPRVSILRTRVEFFANLIVLESKGIDMILGMDWLSKHNGLIDSAQKEVMLTPSSGKELEYVVEKLVTDRAESNKIVLNHLDATSTLDIRTVSEYPDVFSEELPGMPPDCEIEFVIGLVPGTTPIFRRPYRMVVNQLAKLKNNSATTPARQNHARGRVHHVAVEDAQAAPYVIIGMILVNDNNAIMLFDSGASHSFIAANFVQKHNLPYPC
jgi:hypothetical protein